MSFEPATVLFLLRRQSFRLSVFQTRIYPICYGRSAVWRRAGSFSCSHSALCSGRWPGKSFSCFRWPRRAVSLGIPGWNRLVAAAWQASRGNGPAPPTPCLSLLRSRPTGPASFAQAAAPARSAGVVRCNAGSLPAARVSSLAPRRRRGPDRRAPWVGACVAGSLLLSPHSVPSRVRFVCCSFDSERCHDVPPREGTRRAGLS